MPAIASLIGRPHSSGVANASIPPALAAARAPSNSRNSENIVRSRYTDNMHFIFYFYLRIFFSMKRKQDKNSTTEQVKKGQIRIKVSLYECDIGLLLVVTLKI